MDIKFEGLDEIIKKVENSYNQVEMEKIDKKILRKCGEISAPVVKRNTPKSKDNKKSGKKGYRPDGHLSENIPNKVVKRKGSYYAIVGWESKTISKSNWFYAKYLEWGTSKKPPIGMFGKTKVQLKPKYEEIAKEEYEKVLKDTLEG
ncbi:MAG: HK97-gp10 family putative phage morphogenesis protein [Clostridium sp.]|jgi:HK97 gp10 family phage protein|nr:HK97 gp10 family phage protein [Clostridium sp.]